MNQQVNTVAPATIGRVVWVWLGDDADADDFGVLDNAQAFKADVVFVHPNGNITVAGRDHRGGEFTLEDVPLENPNTFCGDATDAHFLEGADFTYATWMPYQKAQHEKQATETSAAQAAVGSVTGGATLGNRPVDQFTGTLIPSTESHSPMEPFRTTEGRVESTRPSEVLKPGETAETPEAAGTGVTPGTDAAQNASGGVSGTDPSLILTDGKDV